MQCKRLPSGYHDVKQDAAGRCNQQEAARLCFILAYVHVGFVGSATCRSFKSGLVTDGDS